MMTTPEEGDEEIAMSNTSSNTITVVAPSDMPGGYEFYAEGGNGTSCKVRVVRNETRCYVYLENYMSCVFLCVGGDFVHSLLSYGCFRSLQIQQTPAHSIVLSSLLFSFSPPT
jgi:hypothetical protein